MGKILCILLLLAVSMAHGPEVPSAGTVYVVLAVDTETRSLAPYDSLPELDLRDFETTGSVGAMMTDVGRAPFRDSYGLPPKFTWFVLTHEAYVTAGRGTAVLQALLKYRPRMDRFGDVIGWHYHNCDWQSSPIGGAWRQLTTFSGASTSHGTDIELAEQMIALLIIERGTYPTLFRSGWVWENTDFSNWLDTIAPFDFSNAAPLRQGQGAIESESDGADRYDWSRAAADWTPYHPSPCDYQRPGENRRTIFRCLPGHRSSDLRLESAFARAGGGEDVVVAAYTHSYNDLEKFCRVVAASISNAQMLYPQVRFRYVNAYEAARVMCRSTDTIPPYGRVERDDSRLTLIVDEPLFAMPFGAIRTIDDRYRRLRPLAALPDTTRGDYRWTFDLTGEQYDLFAAGGTDPSGNGFVTDLYGPASVTGPHAHEKTDSR